jgi:hypothetical protein
VRETSFHIPICVAADEPTEKGRERKVNSRERVGREATGAGHECLESPVGGGRWRSSNPSADLTTHNRSEREIKRRLDGGKEIGPIFSASFLDLRMLRGLK